MKLAIFAATGGIGRQALEQAFAAGHEVTGRICGAVPSFHALTSPI